MGVDKAAVVYSSTTDGSDNDKDGAKSRRTLPEWGEGESSAHDPASLPEPASSSVSWLNWSIVMLLSLGAVIAFVDRTSIASVLAAKEFKQQFMITDVERGLLSSAFFWSYAALQIPMGWLVDRYGVKWPYTIMFVVWCLASAGSGMTTTFAGILLMRLFAGAGEAIVIPATYRWIRSHLPEQRLGLAIGIYVLGTKIGPAIGGPFAAWLIVKHAWQTMFFITGLGGLLWLVPWLFLIGKSEASDATVAQRRQDVSKVKIGKIFSSPLIWGAVIVTFCYNYFVFYIMTWMPIHLVEQRGLSLQKSGIYFFFSFIGIAIVALASGWAADWLINRGQDAVIVRKSFVVGGFVLGCTELLGGYSSSVDVALIWSIVSFSGLGLATANLLTLCRLTFIPAPVVGFVAGLLNVATSLAGIVAPALSGWLLQVSGGYEAPMNAIFLFMLLGAGSCIVMLRRKWAPEA